MTAAAVGPKYLVDTDVVSETAKPSPHAGVLRWLSEHQRLAISAVTVFELARGVESVTAPGKRKFLDEWLAALLSGPFDVLPFDTGAALAASEIEGSARRAGRPIDTRDLFILATARAAGMSVATRNGRHFRGRGVLVVDPFGGAELREE